MGGGVSLYRAEALLLPVVLLLRGRLSTALALAGAATLVVPMGRLFFAGVLV